MTADTALLEATLVEMVHSAGLGGAVSPVDVARRIAGDHPDGWGPLMQPMRRIAVRLAKEGRLVIYRKGKPADPEDFRGLYRIGLARLD